MLTGEYCTWKNIATAVCGMVIIVIAGKEASVMPFLDHHECYRRLIVWL